MKAIAKFLTLVTALVLLAGGYLVWASEMKAAPAGGTVESAADRIEAFNGICQSAQIGSSDLVMYENSVDYGAEQYLFITYTLQLRNLNALPAEWIQLEIEPQQGDVLMVRSDVADIPAFSEGLVTVVLMTDRSTAGYARQATLTYYVYGHEISIPVELTT